MEADATALPYSIAINPNVGWASLPVLVYDASSFLRITVQHCD